MKNAIRKQPLRLLESLLLVAVLALQSTAADEHVVFAEHEPFSSELADETIELVDLSPPKMLVADAGAISQVGCETCGEISCGCDQIVGCDSMGGSSRGSMINLGLAGKCPVNWVQAEYLMWWSAGLPTPALIARATEQNPEIGTPLVGGSAGDLLEGMRSGMRIRAGHWLDNCETYGIEFEYLFLDTISDSYAYGDNGAIGSTVYTRPFFNVLTNRPDAELISFPNEIRGTGSVQAEGDFHSAGVRLIWNQCRQCCTPCGPCGSIVNQSRFDILAGYRFVSLDESIVVHEDLRSISPPAGTIYDIHDRFATSNRFHGAEAGVRWQEQYDRYTLELLGKLAFGSNRQSVRISGNTTATNGPNFNDEPSGILAQPTNVGNYSRNRFALIPELGATVGYAFRKNWRATLGYSIIYWDRVVRPGEQIDTSVNPNFFPPANVGTADPLRPEFQWRENGFWTQGISFGLAYNR